MPLDGLMLYGVVKELKASLIGGVIDKIQQPSKDEIILTIRSNGSNKKLLLSSNANCSRIHLTETNRPNPQTAPLFCMLLRKHINRGRILDIEQAGFERIVNIYIETYDELGDLVKKVLTIEIMGKHSNIILINKNTGSVIDSIKHVDFEISRVREIMPGRFYTLPPSDPKLNINDISFDNFNNLFSKDKDSEPNMKISQFLLKTIQGMSNFTASKICSIAQIESFEVLSSIEYSKIKSIFEVLEIIKQSIAADNFKGYIVKNNINQYSDFSFKFYDPDEVNCFDSLNDTLDIFYKTKDFQNSLNSKKSNTNRTIKDVLHRLEKKLSIHKDVVKSSKNYDIYRVYGDLINSNLYNIEDGSSKFITQNFYDENMSEIEIPLEKNLSAVQNSQKYYKKYNKSKKSYSFSIDAIKSIEDEIYYLESQISNIEMADSLKDIDEILAQVQDEGYVKKSLNNKGKQKNTKLEISKPHHYLSVNGMDIYVGKNNVQNDNLTLKFAQKEDIWLHVKKIPGSHVIIKLNGKELDDTTLLNASMLAAFYSKARLSSSVAVDYTERKNVKKPSGAKPGMVIYETNKTIYITPDENAVNQLKKIE